MTVEVGGWVELLLLPLLGSAEAGIGPVGVQVEEHRRGREEEDIRPEGGSRLDCRIQGVRSLLVRLEGGSLGSTAVPVAGLRTPVPVLAPEGVDLRDLRRARLVEGDIRLEVVRRSRTL
jgi:hypothetical protein